MNIQDIFDLNQMQAAYKNKDVKKLLSFYAENAKVVQVMVSTNQKNVFSGHDEIGKTYSDLFSEIFDYEYFDELLIVSGDTALFTFQWAELEKGKRKQANFASWVLQKEADSQWRILIDTYRC